MEVRALANLLLNIEPSQASRHDCADFAEEKRREHVGEVDLARAFKSSRG